MRLIDADELIERLSGKGANDLDLFLNERMVYLLNNEPTAYDVKSVVQQLEEQADEANDKWMAYGQEDDYFDGKEDGIREAIEIVKSGGAE